MLSPICFRMKDVNTVHNLKSSAELFDSGNYTAVAMEGSPDQWQTYAALGLIGKTQEAIEGLRRFKQPEAYFYTAVAKWIAGDETGAAHILERLDSPHAQNLLTLIRKPEIRVLAQLPWARSGPWALVRAAEQDTKFKVQNISFEPGDIQNKPYADVHKFYNRRNPPDFYICQMIEWHAVPPNLQELPCPTFGQTADYDLHIQTVYPWLQIFDELVVTDQTEWQDVRKLVCVPVSTFPKSFGVVDNDLPSLTHKQKREIDIFVSGTMLHPYHPDKAKLLHEILRMPDTKLVIVNGFLDHGRYYDLLAKSKLCFTYYRHSGGMVTRGLEALALGCVIIVQKGSVMQLYVGEQEGVLTYRSHAGDLTSAIQLVLKEWPQFEQRARLGAEIIRREFDIRVVGSQYLRFLTFRTAKACNKRRKQPPRQLNQKRSILCKGWLPRRPGILLKIQEQNLERWQAKLGAEDSPRLFIDMARELVLQYATPCALSSSVNGELCGDKRLLKEAMKLYRTGVARFPRSLVLYFNFIRTALHFGRPKDVADALQLAEYVVGTPVSGWDIDIMEDVFPWDFCSNFFNYRKYFDLITEHLMDATEIQSALTNLILASLHYYLGRYTKSIDHLKQAVSLDPDFPFYQLWYAKCLLERQRPGDVDKAISLLMKMAENSILLVEAYYLLRHLQTQGLFTSLRLKEISQVVGRAEQQFIFLEDPGLEVLQPVFDASRDAHLVHVDPGVRVHKRLETHTPPKVSVILVNWPCSQGLHALDSLSSQTIPRDQYELIWVELYSHVTPEAMEKADVVLSCGQEGLYNKHAGYNAGLLYAKGQIVTICGCDAVFPSDLLDSVIESFNLNSSDEPASIVLFHGGQEGHFHHRKMMSGLRKIQKHSDRVAWSNIKMCMSVRRLDAIRFGGFDEHRIFRGYFGGPYELGWRLLNAGLPEIWDDKRLISCGSIPRDKSFTLDESFSWKLWHEIAYTEVRNLKTFYRSFTGKVLPLQENKHIHVLRMSLLLKRERLKLHLLTILESTVVRAIKMLARFRIYSVARSLYHSLRNKK